MLCQQNNEGNMIDVKIAVKTAMSFFNEMYPDNDFKNILLEEIELSDDQSYWNVTIGFSKYLPELSSPMAQITSGSAGHRRVYKIFKVDSKDGTVKAMMIRDNA